LAAALPADWVWLGATCWSLDPVQPSAAGAGAAGLSLKVFVADDASTGARAGGVVAVGAAVGRATAAGATVATTQTDARGAYVFRGLDLGGFRVVVTPPASGGANVTSRLVTITRDVNVRDANVGLPPKPAAPAPAARPAAQRPAAPARPLSPQAAAFAGLASGTAGQVSGPSLSAIPKRR
jgi:hypothetical protein